MKFSIVPARVVQHTLDLRAKTYVKKEEDAPKEQEPPMSEELPPMADFVTKPTEEVMADWDAVQAKRTKRKRGAE